MQVRLNFNRDSQIQNPSTRLTSHYAISLLMSSLQARYNDNRKKTCTSSYYLLKIHSLKIFAAFDPNGLSCGAFFDPVNEFLHLAMLCKPLNRMVVAG